MDLRIFIEPQQGASYDQQLRLARATEDAGYDAFFRSDHYLAMSGDGRPGPTDAWVTLAGLARETARLRLGTMVTAATFRLPGPLAISVAQVDAMSGGRVELGLGAGWFEGEHTAYGIPFPPVGERFDRLEEQLAIVTGLWSATGPFSYQGRHYRLVDSPALPKPVQSPLPVIVGGAGRKRTPALAARYAAEFNVPFRPSTEARELYGLVREASTAAGRTGPMVFSAAQTVCCGKDEAEYRRRAAAISRDPDQLRARGVAGTVAEVVDAIGAYQAAGATRMYLQTLDIDDLDHVELIAAEVAPQL
ncbi:MAG TPA: LLM class F420-dependent oxidoreductase [Mycobacteriales bacterium]